MLTRSTILLPLTSSSLHHKFNLISPNLRFSPLKCSTSTSTPKSPVCPPPVCRNSPKTIPPPASAYIHLPFCRKRCHYCDFPIVALGSSSPHPDTDPRISNYVHLLLREIQSTTQTHTTPLDTVFFGGGTPSLVPPRLIASILNLLGEKFGVSPNTEVSIEMDPGTFDRSKLRELVDMGVNRVSLGVQAFQDELLRSCGRAHGLTEVEDAIEIVGGCDGVENWSLDLISSLPHQSKEMWEESLKQAVAAHPTHVSVYDLQVEQGTKFASLYNPGEFPLPTEAQSADFYKMASRTLTEAGYNHYEISSYCKKGCECKHNLTYWQNKPFYGFGLGSASCVNGVRFSRPKRMKEYAEYVAMLENGETTHATAASSVEACRELAMDVVMLSLRTAAGLDVKGFAREFGESLARALCEGFEPYIESGHVIAMDEERRRLSSNEEVKKTEVAFLRLSSPEGFLLSNELISIAFGVISP